MPARPNKCGTSARGRNGARRRIDEVRRMVAMDGTAAIVAMRGEATAVMGVMGVMGVMRDVSATRCGSGGDPSASASGATTEHGEVTALLGVSGVPMSFACVRMGRGDASSHAQEAMNQGW